MAEFLTTLLVFVVTFILGAYFLSNRKQTPASYPRGPKGVPLFGNLLDINKSDKTGPSILKKWADEFGALYSLRLGSHDAVVLNTPHVIREALSKLGDHTSGRASNLFFFTKVVGIMGIVQNEGDAWKATRRAALRAMRDFGMGKKSLEQRIQEEARAMVGVLDSQDGQPFDPVLILNNVTSNVICSIVFGERYDYDDKEFQQLSTLLNYLFKTGGFKNPEIFMPLMLITTPIRNRPFFKAVKVIRTLRGIVKERIQKHREMFDPCDIKSFIDIYLKAEQDGELQDKNIEDNLLASIFDLFVAGSETSSTTLRWALLYFVHYPQVQAKCQQEIREVIGQVRPPVNNDRVKMQYMEATIYELQRISNIAAYGVLHRCTETMELAGHTIPKDTLLLTNLHAVHMDQQYWGDPEIFRPERWLDGNGSLIKHDYFMPFSTGPRECLGKSLALQEIFIILVSLLQKFTFRAKDPKHVPPLQGVMGITHSPNNYEIIAEKC